MSTVKAQLLQLCHTQIQDRILLAKEAMRHAQESANSEEKSSAGDKYETGRAMAQIERDQAAHQLEEGLKLKSVLDKINPSLPHNIVTLGSLVITDKSKFFISISLGKMEFDGKEYFVVSPQSPIGKLLLNRNKKDVISFNNQNHTIVEIL
jgi:transcription elongation GreA/GreB family factor